MVTADRETHQFAPNLVKRALLATAFTFACFCVLATIAVAQPQLSVSVEDNTMIIGEAGDMEVVAFGRSVVIKGRAKGVLSVGGDVTIEGRVDGDVATIGGSIIQKSGAYVGGDVIAFGGAYKPEDAQPLRESEKETVVFGMFEEELRSVMQNPAELLSPTWSISFIAQRLLSVLFWFVVSLGFTTIAPGAVGRAVARLHLASLRVFLIGSAAMVFTFFGIGAAVNLLPDYLSVSFGLMVLVLMIVSYLFGRVALQVSMGKLIQKHVLPEGSRSETLAILAGVVFWTILLSLPYVWTLALFILFCAGLGLVLTARSNPSWHNS